MEKNDILTELKAFIKSNKIKQVDLANAINVRQSVISDMLNGKRKTDRLINYINTAYKMNFKTIIPINDVHLVQDNQTDEQPYMTNSNGIRFFGRPDNKLIMEVPKVTRNALGSPYDDYASYNDDRDSVEKEYFEVDEVHHGTYYSFEVDGDSMDNGTVEGFRRGDIVLVRQLERQLWLPKLHFNKWPFWVVVFGNNVRLKQIVAQDDDSITLHSLNQSPEYTDFDIKLEDIQYLFNVVCKKPKQVKYGNF